MDLSLPIETERLGSAGSGQMISMMFTPTCRHSRSSRMSRAT
jgi:hypothetical protein